MIPVFKGVERQPDGTASVVFFQNLICFILNTGTEILRQLVYTKVKKEDIVKCFSSEKIASQLSKLITNNRLTKEQFEMLKNNPDPDSLDISVLMILLTNENIFDLPHEPLIADLKCLRNLRDGILQHSKLHLNKTLFEGYLKQISEILKRITNFLSVEQQSDIRLRLKSERKRTQQTKLEPNSNAFIVFINWLIQDTDNYQSAIEMIQLKTTTGASTMAERLPPTGRTADDSIDGRVSNESNDAKTETLHEALDRITEAVNNVQSLNSEYVNRTNDDSEDKVKVKNEPHDAKFFGFKDLGQYVFRVCRPDEEISTGIVCKDPLSKRTVEQHIVSGVVLDSNSKYITTTASLDVASLYAFYEMDTQVRSTRQLPLRIVKIDLNVLRGTEVETGCINLTNKEVMAHFIKGTVHRNWVMSSQIVIFTDQIPKYISGKPVYALVYDLVCPSLPPRKKRKKMKTDDLVEDFITEVQKTTPGAERIDETALLTRWATGNSPDGRVFYVNHDTRTATWVKPMNEINDKKQGPFEKEQIYCVACKIRTNTHSLVLCQDPSSKKRSIKGVCSVCGKKKSYFV